MKNCFNKRFSRTAATMTTTRLSLDWRLKYRVSLPGAANIHDILNIHCRHRRRRRPAMCTRRRSSRSWSSFFQDNRSTVKFLREWKANETSFRKEIQMIPNRRKGQKNIFRECVKIGTPCYFIRWLRVFKSPVIHPCSLKWHTKSRCVRWGILTTRKICYFYGFSACEIDWSVDFYVKCK